MFIMSYPPPQGTAHGLISNPNANERSSIKIPERLGRFAEVARMLVRFDHVAGRVVNADDGANVDIRLNSPACSCVSITLPASS
jgi:hypothetical protein